ncbi:hypothetical protein BJ973_008939 [Actinoplanes tereljensis]|uniref:Uncharacterized protein n=1 Tax=Paractinoplanes tereljensis TaxID=571912 RepID=A0A919TQA9_9ACTN|nr:hypothetical protein [Actinoplanes tereljensis]GIF18096.1 hypothetical protein Ate02nite_08260 [Actinoplanes tereljensis]
MTTLRVLAAALATFGLLALVGGGGWWPAAVLLIGLLALGELWLRALVAETVAPAARIGLGAVSGLVSLPMVAVTLHLLGVPLRSSQLAAGLAVLAVLLGGVALLRERSGPVPDDPRFARTLPAIAIPVVVALVVGGAATMAYVRMPHPQQPGFTSVALGGWAAGIDGPVTFPRAGLDVPIRVASAGEPAAVAQLRVSVGSRPAAPARPVTVDADTIQSIAVHVPAPLTGCLHRIEISVGAASTIFYGRGPAKC